MNQAQSNSSPGRPWHLWVVGILGGLWSLIGVMSFVVTQMDLESVMGGFPPEQRAYFLSFPLWADGLWAIGVFAGVIGCILLLLRKRVAFQVLVISAIGAITSNLGGLFLLGGMEVMGKTGGLGFSAVPIVFGLFMATYAGAMTNKGVLR
jgi:hypothetical protein